VSLPFLPSQLTSRLKNEHIIVIAGLLLLLPFVNRAVFVDDHAHYKQALAMADQPTEFYKSDRDFPGWKKGQSPTEANPVVYYYVTGAIIKILGPETWKAHLGFIPFHLAALLCFYYVARRLTKYAVWAALLWLVSPHFWITANSLLIDALLAPMMMLGIATWIKGWEEDHKGWLVLGGIFLGLAPLVKYTGLLSWAVVVLWGTLKSRNKKPLQWSFLLIPIVMMAGWLAWTAHAYGESHFGAVAKTSLLIPTPAHLFTLAAFVSGTTFPIFIPLFVPAFYKTKGRPTLVVLITVGAVLAGIALSPNPGVGVQLGLWAGAFFVWLLFITPNSHRITDNKKLLLAWMGLGVLGLSVAIGWICARYLVIAGPPLILLTLKGLEAEAGQLIKRKDFRAWTFLAVATPSLLLAMADHSQAGTDKQAANELNQLVRTTKHAAKAYYPRTLLSGLSFYLDPGLWTPVSMGESINRGDIVVLPYRTLSPHFFPSIKNPRVVRQFQYHGWVPMRTLDLKSHAGFYGSIWGLLPFSFSQGPLEIYTVVMETGP